MVANLLALSGKVKMKIEGYAVYVPSILQEAVANPIAPFEYFLCHILPQAASATLLALLPIMYPLPHKY